MFSGQGFGSKSGFASHSLVYYFILDFILSGSFSVEAPGAQFLVEGFDGTRDTRPCVSRRTVILPREEGGLGKAIIRLWVAVKRLQKEILEWQNNPPPGFKLNPTDDLSRWTIEFDGATDSFYAGEHFQLLVQFPEKYPLESPEVVFAGSSPVHPHIYSNGHICLDILYDSWSPAMTMSSVCISILSMLSSATAKERPADNDRYVKNCRKGKSPKSTLWEFHDDKA
ncbi:hypothetical protein L7F22_010037 [Adiantum nelumboides]|nr:hypothetical protein [Adiantum nelumboides]